MIHTVCSLLVEFSFHHEEAICHPVAFEKLFFRERIEQLVGSNLGENQSQSFGETIKLSLVVDPTGKVTQI